MARRDKRFTVYDAMEAAGKFDENKANASSPDFEGPVAYPKMFYHPAGETRVTVPAEIIMTPIGPKSVGEQKEIIWEIANNKAQADALRAAGWHDHPGKAIAAAGGKAPAISAEQRIQELEEELRRVQMEKNDTLAKVNAESQGASVTAKQNTKTMVKAASAAAE
jgi:hypothetical protein